MSQNQLVNFYESLLDSLWVQDTGDGSLALNIRSPLEEDEECTSIPARSAKKRLVLPTKKVIKNCDWDEFVAFHPLSENLLRGESDVFKTLLEITRLRLGTTIGILMSTLMELAVDPEKQAHLTARQQKYLQALGKVDKKAAKAVNQLIESANYRFISLYVHRGGGANGIKTRRVAQASFPIWDELHGQGSKLKSSNPSKYNDIECGSAKNKRAISALFEYLIPDPDDKEFWQEGSDNDVAPYFDSLMRLYANIADHLNKHIHLFRKYVPNANWVKFDLDWAEDLENLNKWKNKIPPLPGNEGALMKGETEGSNTRSAASDSRPNFLKQASGIGDEDPSNEGNQDDTPPWQDPAPAPAAIPNQDVAADSGNTGSGNGVSWNSVRSQQQQNQQYGGHNNFQANQQPMTTGWGNNPAPTPRFMGGPGFQQPQQQQSNHMQFNPHANVSQPRQPRFTSPEPIRPTMTSGGYGNGNYGGGSL